VGPVITKSVISLCTTCAAPSAKSYSLSQEYVESSETSPDLSPMHAALPCGTSVVHDDPSKRPVEPGRPTRISVCKGKSGLGVRVIGGSDTNLVSIYDNSLMRDDGYCLVLNFTVPLPPPQIGRGNVLTCV